VRRRKLTAFYLSRQRKVVDEPIVTLTYLFTDQLGPAEVELMAERLAAA
jgi:hypothetical protein